MTKSRILNIIFQISLIIISISVWKLIYDMQFLIYDDNMGNLCVALLLSILAVISIIIIWFKWRKIIGKALLITFLFLITSNPITVMVACVNYEYIFGVQLKM